MRKTHLVGSVPLNSARAAMSAVAQHLGSYLDRLPDGETGDRLAWVGWQQARIAANSALVASEQLDHYGRPSLFRLKEGAEPSDLQFQTFGYAEAAISSYSLFKELKAADIIPQNMRFQVNLPTPLAITAAFFDSASQQSVERGIEDGLLRDLNTIATHIDADQLAIQWDVAIEFAVLKAGLPVWFESPEDAILERLVTLGDAVPKKAHLGYHLCFGDLDHKHFVEPESLQPMVVLANAIAQRLSSPVTWFHLPVPRDRDDADYFASLKDFTAEADLYLGLLHLSDGIAGAEKRIAAASAFRENFGVATECGFGRRPPETIEPLLQLHAAVCAAS